MIMGEILLLNMWIESFYYILQLWKKHKSTCNIFIANKFLNVKCDYDIGVNRLKSYKLESNVKQLKIYLKYNELNYNLIYNWSKSKDKTASGLIDEFNRSTSYITNNRITNI